MRVPRPYLQQAETAAITERLREAVSKSGGPTQISERSEVALSTLNAYLAGGEIKLSNLLQIARACGVSVEWLVVGGAPYPPWLETLVGKNTALQERQEPMPAPSLDTRWLAKAIEIVEALGGAKLPLPERARRIAYSYQLLTAPEADVPPLPPIVPRER